MIKPSAAVAQAKNEAQRAGRIAMDNPWVDLLIRLGYFVRGLLYVIVGVLAVQVALGLGGATTDKNGAIATLGGQPFGKLLLILIAVGLVGYSLWGVMRALFDPLGRGTDAKGIAQRVGYLVSAFSYGSLFVLTARFLAGAGGGSGGGSEEWTATLLRQPFGPFLVGAIGLISMAGGVGQGWLAFTADFKKDWKLDQMSAQMQNWAIAIGRFGLAARGVVFVILGFFVLLAAIRFDPKQAKGMDAALQTLAQQPFGPLLLGVVALGLVAFGVYSMLTGRWIRIERL